MVTHVAVDGGGMGDNLEVSLYGQRFEAALVNRVGSGAGGDGHGGGPALRIGDTLIDGVALADPAVGTCSPCR